MSLPPAEPTVSPIFEWLPAYNVGVAQFDQEHWLLGERLNLTFRRIQPSTAMQSISTRAPLGSAATSTQARAGETPSPNTSA